MKQWDTCLSIVISESLLSHLNVVLHWKVKLSKMNEEVKDSKDKGSGVFSVKFPYSLYL